ncbi:HPr family phosphocarrier protein [Brevibacillus ginsengisoli]|uniref:HPr family phosphocarrier protein n=1 Tax=Brevibacillus ginsengisoli TaxID=363854 RepID=UPI003CF35E21
MRIEKELIVKRPDGIHARPASEIVKRMKGFESSVEVKYNSRIINAKSIIQLMSLAVKQGEALTVVIDGADAEEALSSLEEILCENAE